MWWVPESCAIVPGCLSIGPTDWHARASLTELTSSLRSRPGPTGRRRQRPIDRSTATVRAAALVATSCGWPRAYQSPQ